MAKFKLSDLLVVITLYLLRGEYVRDHLEKPMDLSSSRILGAEDSNNCASHVQSLQHYKPSHMHEIRYRLFFCTSTSGS